MKDRFTDFGLLLLRALTGLGLMYHGWLKVVLGVSAFSDVLFKLGTPFDYAPLLFAWLSILAELLGGFFLFLGLWARLAAIALIINMSVASFIGLAGKPIISATSPITRETPLLYLTIVVTLFILGPGRFAVDAGRGGKRSSAPKKAKKS
jgi:putative oxidoreductase